MKTSEHPFIRALRQGLVDYRMKSPAHCVLQIALGFPYNIDRWLTRETKVKMEFSTWNRPPIEVMCRPQFRTDTFLEKIQVLSRGQWISLHQFLWRDFPPVHALVDQSTMLEWWVSNGKYFNWEGLPTEIKEHIIEYCILEPTKRKVFGQHRPKKLNEIIIRLGLWASLLRTSLQVRAIVLRKCLENFHIYSFRAADLLCRLDRLSSFFQITDLKNVPTNPQEWTMAETYALHPKIYPHLSRFSTFRHGLRKIGLRFSFVDTMHFFKVEAGGFQQAFPDSYHCDCDIFETLPNLKYVLINLPSTTMGIKEDKMEPNRAKIFHPESPCPRLLHRLIYEPVAYLLAHYDVEVLGFGDEEEVRRYRELRLAATASLKFTHDELAELYAECGGGVQLPLEDIILHRNSLHNLKVTENPQETFDNHIYPPRCICDVPCIQTFDV
ncbi:hypothetical protein BS50DRAFT_679492 [Corynespora cassiicola Philippines]|uniref:Uncharacterized protein n=1 Tax=Corynespora cassiicola Philippines TaxID=1448308 RepID=A0A2T2NCK5_CORCC|nr:hypothetical protein BS50DRAFT_679492 [Corynespora cassiicola Philippines]